MVFALRWASIFYLSIMVSSCWLFGDEDKSEKGDSCEQDAHCLSENRSCVNENGTAACGDCLEGFHQEDLACIKNEQCTADSCSSHGVCDDTEHPLSCTCHSGYTGTTCDACDTALGYQDVGSGICQKCEDQDGDSKLALTVDCSSGTDWCDDDADNWSEVGCLSCLDLDADGFGADCDKGTDCDDDNALVHLDCIVCFDMDEDGLDGYDAQDCPDGLDTCDDDEANWTEFGCLNCVDDDQDGYGTDCDQGDDCDDLDESIHQDCVVCIDSDLDGHDAYDALLCPEGDDLCDDDTINWTQTGCLFCLDLDGDGFGTDCDLSDDCDDTDDSIYSGCSAGGGFRVISKGAFVMGSPEEEIGRYTGETHHQVVLTHDFEIMDAEVTQIQFQSLVTWNPSWRPECGDNCPVEYVSWYDALYYANLLSSEDGFEPCFQFSEVECDDFTDAQNDPSLCMNDTAGGIIFATVTLSGVSSVYDCIGYRLPTEAEWEYAARAGTQTAFYSGDIDDTSTDADLDPIAWYLDNASQSTHTTATRTQNSWGLFDMLGNVREWTWDGFYDYTADTVSDPEHLPDEFNPYKRMVRNCGYVDSARNCRAANRSAEAGGTRLAWIGFRLVRSLPSN